MLNILHDASIARLVHIALAEDIGSGDITTELIVPESCYARATIIAKAHGIVCGLPVAQLVFCTVDPAVVVEPLQTDGSAAQPGDVLATVHGPTRSLLSAERTALNFLQRTCGVATLTRAFVERIHGTKATILDTRKTLPGWRLLDKYACMIGGATSHRLGLYDMVLIKDNHITAAGSIRAALEAVRPILQDGNVLIEIEVQSLEQLDETLACGGFHRIMLDNFTLEDLRRAVTLINGRYQTEASGGITLENVRQVALTGVDYISVGALTHSAVALDISMEIEV